MIRSYTLQNRDSKIEILNWGATLKSWKVKNSEGREIDVVLGFNDNERYQQKHPSFGCVVGRYANRIAKGRFTLNGKEYQLDVNNGPNHLHGGMERFGNRIWDVVRHDENTLELSYISPSGESHYPGRLNISITYKLSEDNTFSIEYLASSDEDTICNLTNHTYFNLGGESSDSILDHKFQINATHFLPTDVESIPTGVYQAVEGTVMDFLKPRTINTVDFQDPLLVNTKGYDHNYVLSRTKSYRLAASVISNESNLKLDCYTDQPGLQFFTANGLSDIPNKSGESYSPYSGFCLEAQLFPDSPNQAHFPSPILRKGENYTQKTAYRIEVL